MFGALNHRRRCRNNATTLWHIAALWAFCGQWKQRGAIADDPHVTANGGFLRRGMVSFAGGGSDSRTTQLFVSLRDSKYLGKANWETPVAQVVEGMDVVDAWYKGCAAVRHHHVASPVVVQLQVSHSCWLWTQLRRLVTSRWARAGAVSANASWLGVRV